VDLVSPKTDSLLDFLYVDRDRLQSYAAQLFNAGVLTTTKTIDQTTSQSAGQIGVPGTNLSINGGSISSQEQLFDSSHTLPLNVLDRLDELGHIRDGVGATALGELFLVHGRMRFIDYKIIQKSWDCIHNATIQEQQSKGQHLSNAQKAVLKNNFKILESLPHSTELTFHTGTESLWSCLNPCHLRVDPATLAFAHGTAIPGEWTMLAILDARPYDEEEELENLVKMPIVREMQLGMHQALEGIRGILGRPYTFFAVTPVLVFRYSKPPAELDIG
jgi:hypothetical protein